MLSGRKSALSPFGAAVSAAVSGRSLTGLETYQIEASFPPAIAKSDGFQAVVPCLSQPRTVALRYRNLTNIVATDLSPVGVGLFTVARRPTGPWLQRLYLICSDQRTAVVIRPLWRSPSAR